MLSLLHVHMMLHAGGSTATFPEVTSIIRQTSASHAVKKRRATGCITDEPARNLMMLLRFVKA